MLLLSGGLAFGSSLCSMLRAWSRNLGALGFRSGLFQLLDVTDEGPHHENRLLSSNDTPGIVSSKLARILLHGSLRHPWLT